MTEGVLLFLSGGGLFVFLGWKFIHVPMVKKWKSRWQEATDALAKCKREKAQMSDHAKAAEKVNEGVVAE